MNCYACNRRCSDKELKEDIRGWIEFKAFCRKCLGSIRPEEDKNVSLICPEIDEEESDE